LPTITSVWQRARAAVEGRSADVVLKSDGGGWILDQFSGQIRRYIDPRMRLYVTAVPVPGLRHRVIHFVGSECFYDPAWTANHPHASNAMIGTWWHGSETSPEASIRAAASRIAAVSGHLARVHVTCGVSGEIVRRLGVPDSKIALVPMGVDLELFRPPAADADRQAARHALGIRDDTFVIGSFQKDGVGWGDGNEPKLIKGPDLFAQVAANLARRHRVLALIPGPSRGYLKNALQAAGVAFRWDGFVPFRKLAPYYHACDLYLMTGREEGGPAMVLESLASGTPLVAHRSGMAPDVVVDGDNGFLVDVGDVASMTDRAERVAVQPGLRQRLAAAGLATARRYAWPVVAAQYERMYREVRA
jgi:glycosyltransferase involved in cell wall biosynthesis